MINSRSAFMKRTEILLLPEDETEVVEALRVRFPTIQLVDNRAWQSVDEVPVRASIAECGSMVALWNPDIVPHLPVAVRANGVIDGPQAGSVIQWLRSVRRGGSVLDAGRWAATVGAITGPDMAGFVRACWRVLMSLTTNKLVRGGELGRTPQRLGAERGFRVGRLALEKARCGELTLASNQMRLLPEQVVLAAE